MFDVRKQPDRHRRSGLALGAFIYSLAAAVWLVIAVQAGGVRNLALIVVAAILNMILLIAALWQMGTAPDEIHQATLGKSLGIIFSLQGGAIGVGAGLLGMLGFVDWIVPWISVVVGIHFFPVGHLFQLLSDYVLGGAILLLVVVTVFALPSAGWAAVIGLGTAILLWLSGWGRLLL